MEPEIVDIALRGAATGICLILASLIWISRIARDAQIALTAVILTSCSRLWTTLPPGIALADPAQGVLRTLGSGGAFAMTWFVLTIFLDDKRFRGVWLGSGAVISAGILATPGLPWIVPALRSYAALHFIGLIGLVLYSGKGDLQNARRRLRPAMSVFLLVYCVTQALTSRPMQGVRSPEAALGQSTVFFLCITLFALWALKANLGHWPGETQPLAQPSAAPRSPDQDLLIGRIQREMAAGVWRNEGLTVGALAQRVNAPEHQVRRAINRGLGHRNFSSFINSARIEAAKSRLETPESSGVTILEIAYDVGFSSLGPFNRAFREATGLSPTDFRRQALGQAVGISAARV